MQLVFQTVFKLHQTVYEQERALSSDTCMLHPAGWVWKVLERVALASMHTPLQDPQVVLIVDTLRRISHEAAWLACSRPPPSEVSLEAALETFEALETAVSGLDVPPQQQARRASRVRLWLQRGLLDFGVPRAERLVVHYRPRFVAGRGQPRKMISDLPSAPSAPAEHPIGALPHQSVRELVAAERRRRELDLAKVESAALAELEEHDSRLAAFDALLGAYPTSVRAATEREMEYVAERLPKWMLETSPHELAATYYQILNDRGFWLRRQSPALRTPGARLVFDFLESAVGQPIPKYRLVETLVRVMAPQQVLTGCLLLLQAHTGWNVNSVLEMKRDMISGKYPKYSIQGFKGRIRQLTPVVELSSANAGALRALRLLLDRYDWLLEHRWIPPTEKRLWLNPVSIQNDPEPKQYVGWGSSLTSLIAKHALPNFSFEQLRVQKLSLISLSSAGVRGAQDVAGHLQLSTTGHYLEQEVLLRLRSAMNLEFQRTLEAAVTYDFPTANRSRSERYRYLLRDVGDGSSCAAPTEPPWESELINGECKASRCHADEGCPKRVIEVNPQTLEAAVRTHRFYASNVSVRRRPS